MTCDNRRFVPRSGLVSSLCARLLLLLVVLLAGVLLAEAAGAAPPPTAVTLTVAAGSHGRLAEELRQELDASGFAVRTIPGAAGADPDSSLAGEGVVVAVHDQSVTIFAPGASFSGAAPPTELRAEADDRPARRRLCLAVVERLRRWQAERPPPPTTPPASDAPAPATLLPVPTPTAAAIAPPVDRQPAPLRRPWALGAASALNILSVRGTPTGHVVLSAEKGLTDRLALVLRAAWPILGAQFTDQGRFVRTWTFGTDVGVNLRLVDSAARLRPVIGAAVGAGVALVDTDEFELRSSAIDFLPALTGALNAGLRLRLRPLVDLFVQADVTQGLLLAKDVRDYERDAAVERLFRIALGVMFEY